MSNYDNWLTSRPGYDYDVEVDEMEGWIKEDDVPCIVGCTNAINSLIKAVYETGDINEIELAIDDLTHFYGLPEVYTKPKIEKKETEFSRFVDFTRDYAEKMKGVE